MSCVVGYWKGIAGVKELANAAKVSPKAAKKCLVKQALWQVYLPAPRYISRPKFDIFSRNAVHQADLFLPHDTLGQGHRPRTYKYALTVVDVASRYKAAEALTSKESVKVAKVTVRTWASVKRKSNDRRECTKKLKSDWCESKNKEEAIGSRATGIRQNFGDRYKKGVVCEVLPIKATILTKVER